MSAPAAVTKRLDFLDGLRALAALTVLVYHDQISAWDHVVSRTTFAGRISVDVFIVISGFCLMLPVIRRNGVLRGGALRFFARRARRILPPYYFALGFSAILALTIIRQKTGTHWDVSIPVTARGVLGHILLIQDVWHPSEINYVFWSIAVEWQIYFLFPLLLVAWRTIGGAATSALAAVASLMVYERVLGTDLVGLTPQYLGLFTFGMLAAATSADDRPEVAETRWTRIAVALLALACIPLLLGWTLHLHSIRCAIEDTLVGLAAAAWLLALTRSPGGWVYRAMSAPPLVRIGRFSYSLYLIHAPLVQVIWQYGTHPFRLGPWATFATLVIVGTPLIVYAASIFSQLFEEPFLPVSDEGSRMTGPVAHVA